VDALKQKIMDSSPALHHFAHFGRIGAAKHPASLRWSTHLLQLEADAGSEMTLYSGGGC